ncbi:MAG: hypothetical protein R6X08_12435 [Desulfosalsimonadaceae bacterium]
MVRRVNLNTVIRNTGKARNQGFGLEFMALPAEAPLARNEDFNPIDIDRCYGWLDKNSVDNADSNI